MIIGMLLGALCAALWANNVSLRWPTSRRRLLQGLIGGIIAGFGARLAMGCNLAAFFTGIPMFSLHAWAFMLATVGGAWIGVKICLLPWLRTPLKVGSQASSLFGDVEGTRRRASLQARLGTGWRCWPSHSLPGASMPRWCWAWRCCSACCSAG